MVSRSFARFALAAFTVLCLSASGVLAGNAPGLNKDDIHALIKNFRSVDTDGNGILSHGELAAHFHWTIPAEHASKGEDKAHGFSKYALIRMLKDFPAIDSDKDGVLNHQELIAFYHPTAHAGCDHANCEKAKAGKCCGKCQQPTQCEKQKASCEKSACPRRHGCHKARCHHCHHCHHRHHHHHCGGSHCHHCHD